MSNYVIIYPAGESSVQFPVMEEHLERELNKLNFANFTTVAHVTDSYINSWAELYFNDTLVLEGYITEIINVDPHKFKVTMIEFATELETYYVAQGDITNPDNMKFDTAVSASVNSTVDKLLHGASPANWGKGSSSTRPTLPNGNPTPALRFRYVSIKKALTWYLSTLHNFDVWYRKTGSNRYVHFANVNDSGYTPSSHGRTTHSGVINVSYEKQNYQAINRAIERVLVVDSTGDYKGQAIKAGATSPYDTLIYRYEGGLSTEAANAMADGVLRARQNSLKRLVYEVRGIETKYYEGDKVYISINNAAPIWFVVHDVIIKDGKTSIGVGDPEEDVFDVYGNSLRIMNGEGGVGGSILEDLEGKIDTGGAAEDVNTHPVIINADKINLSGKTIDDFSDGTQYARVNKTSITAGNIVLSETMTSASAQHVTGTQKSTWSSYGNIDNISNGTTYSRIKTAALNAQGMVLMDQVVDGTTYGKVRSTQISAGYIQLTSQSQFSGQWYDKSSVVIDAESGIQLIAGGETGSTPIKFVHGSSQSRIYQSYTTMVLSNPQGFIQIGNWPNGVWINDLSLSRIRPTGTNILFDVANSTHSISPYTNKVGQLGTSSLRWNKTYTTLIMNGDWHTDEGCLTYSGIWLAYRTGGAWRWIQSTT